MTTLAMMTMASTMTITYDDDDMLTTTMMTTATTTMMTISIH